MTASDAMKLTEVAIGRDSEKVKIVLDLWYAAIRKAAQAGRTSVREGDCDTVRTPIPVAARVAAIEQLRRDGFTAHHEAVGPNETEMTISWAAKPKPPQGGSGTARPTVGPKGGTGTPPRAK